MKKQLKKILQPVMLPYWWQDLLLLVPRVVSGYLLTADFGAAKFGLPWSPPENNLKLFEVAYWFPNDVAEYGGVFALFPAFFAWMGAFSEGVGGLLLIFGLLTRPVSILIICTMLVAAFLQNGNEGMWNILPSVSFLWVALYTLFLGSGKFGIDYIIAKKIKP
ncbi:MAG: DoxX family membrane protein [Bacteroidetes bacterium]|nr:MAG: DoxX family membrane protein [Bacteroidota bacterium]